ncbi:CHASE2 domain-containing protein [Blastomonas fulva]|uniref:CHASE2 domain-containing protein n=1 Tax=Blastomonas fulva TaxID=1550728 RepID=UPI0025A335C8|nr:CHASE2 domain-containing protein [Blastomonas fulva]MDM7928352.1 CHASE2 domain-containing protein [Blastomonas fulva]MDM7967172.1 CHASE2 domain-containing protein [Blastomonas fulva]
MRILLIWSLVSALLFGLAEFGEPVDDMFRAIRNKARDHDATGQIAVVGIDSRAQQQIGDWPWSAQRYADMIDRLSQAGARRVFFDFPINVAANDPQLPQLVDAMASMNGHVYIAANFAPESCRQQRRAAATAGSAACRCRIGEHQHPYQRVQRRLAHALQQQGRQPEHPFDRVRHFGRDRQARRGIPDRLCRPPEIAALCQRGRSSGQPRQP